MGQVTGITDLCVDIDTAFRIASEVEKYPDFMPDVKSVEVLERRDDGYARVAWVGHVSVASINKEIKWIEEAWWDSATHSSRFELLEGDYKHYRGSWTFESVPGGTRIRLDIDFDLGLPLVGALIARLLDKIMKDNIDGMLRAIKERAESQKD